MNEAIKIVADMAADLFHSGHVNFLRQVKYYFSNRDVYLAVALHTNEQIFSYKKRYPVMDYNCRREVLLACSYVNEVIPAPDAFDKAFINMFDYQAHGDDLLKWSKEEIEKFYGEAIRQEKLITIPYTSGISTTHLIKNAKSANIFE